MKPRVLIIDRDSSLCPAGSCGTLSALLHTSLAKSCSVIAGDADGLVDRAAAPNLIVLRSAPVDTDSSIASCKTKWPNSALLIIVCSCRDADLNIAALGDGDDFLVCPFHGNELLQRARRLLAPRANRTAKRDHQAEHDVVHFGVLVGKSEAFLRVVHDILPLARADATVLIGGETGTGKELFSRAIHYQSGRQGKPFIPVNCAALPDHLFENELFGHARGAYTDASSAGKGLVAEAEGGTLMLDEIDTLSLGAQAKLLRFLQDGEYRPLGAARALTADVRVIASTNCDLLDKVKSRQFREDLYYRLGSLSLTIPPLRERIEDVVYLANHFAVDFATKHGQAPRSIANEALRRLLAYSWPGNVRELEGVMLRALVLTSSASLQAEDLRIPQSGVKEEVANASLRQVKSRLVQTFERNYLIGLLAEHHGNVSQAAKAAGKQRRTLQRLLVKYAIQRNSFEL